MAILLIQIAFTTLVLLRYVWACVGVYISVWGVWFVVWCVCVGLCVGCVWVWVYRLGSLTLSSSVDKL